MRHQSGMQFKSFMSEALAEAISAGERGEVPVGAVIVKGDNVIASAGNETRARNDPTAHAEILAIRAACRVLDSERLDGCTLYVTLEPCAMCAMAISHARIDRLIYAASDPKSGGVEQGAAIFSQSQTHHKPEVIAGIEESAASDLLRSFFSSKRD